MISMQDKHSILGMYPKKIAKIAKAALQKKQSTKANSSSCAKMQLLCNVIIPSQSNPIGRYPHKALTFASVRTFP